MADTKPTTIRFSEDMYRRLEEVTGLPINSLVVVACLEWLDAHQPEAQPRFSWGQLSRMQVAPSSPWPPKRRRAFYPFNRFTSRAKKILTMAEQQAEASGQSYIGDEHLLLALMKEGQGLAAVVLRGFGLDVEKLAAEIDDVRTRKKPGVIERIGAPTSHTKKVIEFAFEEAHRMKHDHVGTEHLLLGLVREPDTVSATALANLGVTPDRVKGDVERLLAQSQPEQ